MTSATPCATVDHTACINTIRTLSIDAVQAANSGHPGAPMGLAPAAYVLWTRMMKHNPSNPGWADRDRFVLSGGHASALLYSLLHLTGYDLSLDDLKNFRQWGGKTPGHPEYGHTPGVETTTGPLGQGLANAVGMAMAERLMAARFNREGHDIVDHYTWVMCGDGDLMEGVSYEAASMAGHLGLGKLTCLYDDNRITIEGSTQIAFTEDVTARFTAAGWQVLMVEDGNDVAAITNALEMARAETEKPTLIRLRTEIAYGSPNKQGTSDAHGAPLGEEEVRLTKRNLSCPEDECFCVAEDPGALFRSVASMGESAEAAWNEAFAAYEAAYPAEAAGFRADMAGELPGGWETSLPEFTPADGPMATRAASGKALNAAAGAVHTLVGGSADLAPSNKTELAGFADIGKNAWDGRNIRFGVREHAMGAVMNGMILHGGIRPYGGTFLVFADYMRAPIRLAALMNQPAIYVFTHDSVAVGEDGPTHQPVEHLATLRAIPNLNVIRPADATETAVAWKLAIASKNTPTALILSRQKLPVLDRSVLLPADGVEKGAYILIDCDGVPDVILISTGAEVHQALEAREILSEKGVRSRVVSMPSWELFEKQDKTYRDGVLPPNVPRRVSMEAGVTLGWERYAGSSGAIIGINHFGASAPGGVLLKKFGFTAENMVEKALVVCGK